MSIDYITVGKIRDAVETCTKCDKASLSVDTFNKKYHPMLKNNKITESDVEAKFSEMIDRSILYNCNKCENFLYNKEQ